MSHWRLSMNESSKPPFKWYDQFSAIAFNFVFGNHLFLLAFLGFLWRKTVQKIIHIKNKDGIRKKPFFECSEYKIHMFMY